jgi:bifunctional non-homologous end joining protein LigD
VKTTGGKGLHVHVPSDRKADFDQVPAFARGVADLPAAFDPRSGTPPTSARTGGREVVLWMSCAPLSPRPGFLRTPCARGGTPVAATPLDWTEAEDRGLRADRFTIHTVPQRVERDGDPWRAIGRRHRPLDTARRRLDRLLAEDAARTGARR